MDVIRFIRNHSEFVVSSDGFVTFTLDHVDVNSETAFKEELARRLNGVDIDGTQTNVAKFIDEVKTDQLIYITEQAVTLTNMLGALVNTYVNIWTDFNGRPHLVDTTGFNSAAIVILWNKIGTGIQNVRIINHNNDTQVLKEFTIPATPTGQLILEDLNVTLPPAFQNFKGRLRLQAKSSIATDDPVFNGCRIYLRR